MGTNSESVPPDSGEAGMARKTLYRCQCSAVDAGILTRTGESYMGYPMFLIDFGTLVEWTEKKPYEREIEHGLANVKRLPIDPVMLLKRRLGGPRTIRMKRMTA